MMKMMKVSISLYKMILNWVYVKSNELGDLFFKEKVIMKRIQVTT